MNKFYFIKIFYFILSVLLVVISACEYDAGTQVWNPKEKYMPDPIITRIDPDGSVFVDVMEIHIIGDNFLPDKQLNEVYFNNEKATIISASKTELVVVRPKIIGDAITIKVSVAGALHYAKFPSYKLYQIVSEYSSFVKTDILSGLTLDLNENLYTLVQPGYLFRVNAQGERAQIYTTSFIQAKTFHIGPGGLLYADVKIPTKAQVYTYSVASGAIEEQTYCKLPKPLYFFDFDQNHNMYSAGKNTGIYLIDQTLKSKEVGAFADFDIRAIRVFDNYVYVTAVYTGKLTTIAKMGIFRALITNTATGELGPVETYYDWSHSGEFTAVEPGSFTFTEDGIALVGTAHDNPILAINPSGDAGPLYGGLLTPSVDQIFYGANEYFYYLRGNDGKGKDSDLKRIIRVRMTKKGAPYYGRMSG